MKMSPLWAITILVGWVKASGGFQAIPGLPSVNRTLPSGLNLTTMWRLLFSPGNFASSRPFADLWSTTHTEFELERDRDTVFKNIDYYSSSWERARTTSIDAAIELGNQLELKRLSLE